MTLSDYADVAGLVGLAITIWVAWRAKSAAEAARQTAFELRQRIAQLDTLAEVAAAIELLNEIRSLQRLKEWSLVLDRLGHVRRRLVRLANGFNDENRHRLMNARAQFRMMEAKVERARATHALEDRDFLTFMESLADQIDLLERIMIEIKKAGKHDAPNTAS